MSRPATRVYRGRHWSDGASVHVFGQALVRPLGICMLPVMIGALVVMLEGGQPLPFLWMGFPLATVVALFWSRQRLHSDIAEITVDDGRVSLRSRWDVTMRRRPPSATSVLDVRMKETDILVTVGLSTHTLPRQEWPEWDALREDLMQANGSHVHRVRDRIKTRNP